MREEERKGKKEGQSEKGWGANAYHQTMAHYGYSMGRERILPEGLGRTHPRSGSAYVASLVQSVFTVGVVLLALATTLHRQVRRTPAVVDLKST